MSNLSTFQFHNISFAAFLDGKGEPWFQANEVCKALEYKNPRDAIKKHCREWGVAKRDTPTLSGVQSMTYFNEGNLYRLVTKSRKASAQEFERKLFEEILPTLRKTGSYTLTINAEQQRTIQEAVNAYVNKTGKTHQHVYSGLKTRFKIAKYDQLPVTRFDDAIKWLEGEHIPASGYRSQGELEAYFRDADLNAVEYLFESLSKVVERRGVLPRSKIKPPVFTRSSHFDSVRTVQVAQKVAMELKVWGMANLPLEVARDFCAGMDEIYDLLVTGWTEVNEALSAFNRGMHFLNRWNGKSIH